MPRKTISKTVDRLPSFRDFKTSEGDGTEPGITLTVEEYETIRLIDYEGLDQAGCAGRMGVARATVQALYTEARKKLARFLVEGCRLTIEGGNYRLAKEVLCGRERREGRKGNISRERMIIAVTYENGNVFQHFGHTEQFKLYQVEDQKLVSSKVVSTQGQGHGALAGFLKEQGVDVLICGGIGGGAKNALAEAGIRLFGGASGEADAQVESYLKGTLAYNPDVTCSHHDHGEEHSCGGHGKEGHSCQGHSC